MDVKKLSQRIIIGIIIAMSGLVFLLDSLNVAFDGAIGKWYLVLIVAIALILLAVAIINRRVIMLNIAFGLSGLYLSLSITLAGNGVTFLETVPIIFIAIGIGLMFSAIMSSKGKSLAIASAVILVIFGSLLAGVITSTVKYILPAIIIASGLAIILYSIITKKGKRTSAASDNDYYVTPTIKAVDIDETLIDSDAINAKVDSQNNSNN